ncbi:MAG: hypothetical protein KDA68_19240 [Planctomycetaceae bacterium]|nr:hypothetical protein [Planctomycetaceae bacterium]
MQAVSENEPCITEHHVTAFMLGSWERAVSIAIWSVLGLISLILLLRRISGAFTRELSGTAYSWVMFAVTGLMLLSLLLIVEEDERHLLSRRSRTILAAFLMTLFVASLQPLIGIAGWLISLAGMVASCAVAWSPRYCIELGTQFKAHLNKWLPGLLPPIPLSRQSEPAFQSCSYNESASIFPLHLETESEESDPDITLEIVRRKTSEGIYIEGAVQVEFEAGLKQTNIHIPFVPPLKSTENATCLCSGEEVDVQLSALFPYGMRLEARRSSALEPFTSTVHFELQVPNS